MYLVLRIRWSCCSYLYAGSLYACFFCIIVNIFTQITILIYPLFFVICIIFWEFFFNSWSFFYIMCNCWRGLKSSMWREWNIPQMKNVMRNVVEMQRWSHILWYAWGSKQSFSMEDNFPYFNFEKNIVQEIIKVHVWCSHSLETRCIIQQY